MLKRYRPLTRRIIDKGVSAGRRLSPGLRRALRRAVLSPAPNAAGVSPLRALQPHAAPPGPSAGAEVVTSFDAWAHRRDLARRAVAALSNAGVESVLL
ncbi:MAG TPA: hypothetical protein DCM67_00210, partial [Propionibacteriaceae bacterium]|nr:hypothetical protein [Propionibacteriaceae bacterium]